MRIGKSLSQSSITMIYIGIKRKGPYLIENYMYFGT